jgi:hypothetical protein
LPPTKRRKTEVSAAVTAYRRRTRRGCGRDAEVASFYSHALRRDNTGLRKEGEREVMARRGDRATGVHTRATRHSSDVVVAAALRGGDAEGVCPYAVSTGELARGWCRTGPRGK